MKRTEPHKRQVALKHPEEESRSMVLPEGKTCGDCWAFQHCEALYGHIQEDEVCDFYPNRFALRKSLERVA